MFGPVKRFVPMPLKRTLRSTFNTWTEAHPLSARVLQLEARLAAVIVDKDQLAFQVRQLNNVAMYLHHWLLTLLPDHLTPSSDARSQIARMLTRHGIGAADVNLAVSKNDVMFQFIVGLLRGTDQSIDAAFIEYIVSGLHMYEVLEAIVRRKFGSFAAVGSCLDFASGYGRLTRFLVRAIDPARIWVSDIKARTVQFQNEQFGVNGFPATAHPEDLTVRERFDLIFVGSLFSHLPEATFEGWARRLWDLLTPTGLLVFTANDVSLLTEPPAGEFVFNAANEERFTRSEDGPLDTAQYGNMYVTETFVRGIADRLPPAQARCCDRFPRGMWGVQDLYVVARDNTSLGELTLPVQESI